ncbi:MAG: redoxin domain-containing protein [Chitinophagales bacterium]|nr:redoxin domain-containing protein [Chitinophagales bacterium]
MRWLGLLLFSILLHAQSIAQLPPEFDSIPPYKRNPQIPEFSLLKTDGNWLVKQQLPEGKPVVFVYFSPDCQHCKTEAKDLAAAKDSVASFQFIWVSYHPIERVRDFALQAGLDKLANHSFTRDPNYKIPSFFRVRFTPFVAVYNAKGQFVEAFEGGADVPTIIASANR